MTGLLRLLGWAHLIAVGCYILLILNCVSAMNVNQRRAPSISRSRWARMENSDGWLASPGPYISGALPSLVPAAATVLQHMHRSVDDGMPFIPVMPSISSPSSPAVPAGDGSTYEVLVGRKSSLAESAAAETVAPLTGSPDVVTGRVAVASEERFVDAAAAATSETASVAGQSHQFQPSILVPVVENHPAQQPNEDDDDEMAQIAQDRSDKYIGGGDDRLPTILKKTDDENLPPGSFYLPAVSRNVDEYYSDSEEAIYIPLKRPEVHGPLYPVRTQVVLVKPNAPPKLPPTARLNNKDDEEEEEEEEEDDDDEEEETRGPNNGSLEEADENSNSVNGFVSKNPLDLVMTVYPNLPKFLPPSQLLNSGSHHGLKNTRLRQQPGSQQPAKAMSVIHEVKVVTPPHGYLPSLSLKPGAGEGKIRSPIKPGGTAAGNDPLTQLKSSAQIVKSSAAAAAAAVSPTVHHDQRNNKPTAPVAITHSHQAPKYTPFTTDDISPLNFIYPPLPGILSASTTERITTDLQHLHQPHRDQLAEASGHVLPSNSQHNYVPHVHPKSMDFRWNVSAPPSGWFRSPSNTLQQQQRPQNEQQQPQQPSKQEGSSTHLDLVVPGDTSEVIVRTKMATSPNVGAGNSGQLYSVAPSSSSGDAIEIITGYFDDPSASDDIKPLDEPVLPQTTLSPSPPPSLSTDVNGGQETDLTSAPSISSPKLHGDFQPMDNHDGSSHHHHHNEPHLADPVGQDERNKPTDEEHHQPTFMEEVPAPALGPLRPTSAPDDDDDVYGIPRSPDLLFNDSPDQQVADSQIHETTAYEENLPKVIPLKPHEAAEADSEKWSSLLYYKPGKLSPKGAMYTINQGHSKVKFFGFNALHGAAELLYPDGKYLLFHQQTEPGWVGSRFNPYLPVRVPQRSHASSSGKIVPKKSVPVSSKGNKTTTTIRPVFFAKRPSSLSTDNDAVGQTVDPDSSDGNTRGNLGISDPFEYHAHLQKMSEDRLPSHPPPS